MEIDWSAPFYDDQNLPLSGSISSSILYDKMTLIVGIKTKESCILASDSKQVHSGGVADSKAKKIYRCGKSCAVGIAGEGGVVVNVLEGCGYIGVPDIDPRQLAEDIANAFRAYLLGKRDIKDWRLDCPRVQRVDWNRGPDMSAIVAGFYGGKPVLIGFNRRSGYSCSSCGQFSAIGARFELAQSILQTFLPVDEVPAPELAKFLCSLCIVATSKVWPHFIDDDIQMYEISETGVACVTAEPFKVRAHGIVSTLHDLIDASNLQAQDQRGLHHADD